MSEAIQIYHKPVTAELEAIDHEVIAKGTTPSLSDWLFVKAFVVISLILLSLLAWKFVSIFS